MGIITSRWIALPMAAMALLAIVGVRPASACSCGSDLATYVEEIAAGREAPPPLVFTGAIVETGESTLFDDARFPDLDPGVLYRYEVDEVFAGETGASTLIHTTGDSGSCGYSIDGPHVVLAWSRPPDAFTSDLCSTGFVPPATLEAAFGPAREPFANEPVPLTEEDGGAEEDGEAEALPLESTGADRSSDSSTRDLLIVGGALFAVAAGTLTILFGGRKSSSDGRS